MKAESLSARAVLITGTSSGIGKACALHLDRLGYQVIAGVRKTADGTALQKTASPRLIPVHLDVTDGSSIAAAKALIAQKTGDSGLFSLVNNAGFGLAGPLEFQPVAELRQQMEVNLFGVVSVTQAMIPLLRQGRGRIINIGSTLALIEKLPTPIRDWIIVRQLPKYGEGLGRKGIF